MDHDSYMSGSKEQNIRIFEISLFTFFNDNDNQFFFIFSQFNFAFYPTYLLWYNIIQHIGQFAITILGLANPTTKIFIIALVYM